MGIKLKQNISKQTMNRLTKAQVLALFLGSSMALEPLELLNGPGSEARIPAG